MKKRVFAILMMLPYMAMAEGDVLGGSQKAAKGAGEMVAIGFALVLMALWAVPILIGFLIYNSRKKKAEQSHEDMGLSAAGMVLASVILSFAAVFFFEGGVGQAVKQDATTFSQGVKAVVGPIVNHGIELITGNKQ